MRILYIISSNQCGGGEIHLLSLINKIKDIYNIDVLLPDNGWLNNELKKIKFNGNIFHAPLFDNADVYSFLKIVYRILREDYDIVHCHLNRASLLGSLACKLCKVKCVTTSHGLSKGFYYKYSKKIIGVSEAVKTHLVNNGVDSKKIEVIYNGIELNYSNEIDKELVKQIDELKHRKKILLLYPARFQVNKNHKMLVDWIKSTKIENVVLLFAGDGEYKKEIEKEILTVKHKVLMLGLVKNIRELMKLCDYFVFPSLQEAFPISILEAMAEKLPIIATNIEGVRESIEDNITGVLFSPNNYNEFEEKLHLLINNPELKKQICKNAQEKLRRYYLIDQMVEKTIKLYKNYHEDSL